MNEVTRHYRRVVVAAATVAVIAAAITAAIAAAIAAF
jgi:hypothetical protein